VSIPKTKDQSVQVMAMPKRWTPMQPFNHSKFPGCCNSSATELPALGPVMEASG
jgi:hypothetical protein